MQKAIDTLWAGTPPTWPIYHCALLLLSIGCPSVSNRSNRYGAINSFAGCKTFHEMRAETSGIAKWYDEMQKAVSEHRGAHLLAEKCKNLDQIPLD